MANSMFYKLQLRGVLGSNYVTSLLRCKGNCSLPLHLCLYAQEINGLVP